MHVLRREVPSRVFEAKTPRVARERPGVATRSGIGRHITCSVKGLNPAATSGLSVARPLLELMKRSRLGRFASRLRALGVTRPYRVTDR
jgi:hypothetical protein